MPTFGRLLKRTCHCHCLPPSVLWCLRGKVGGFRCVGFSNSSGGITPGGRARLLGMHPEGELLSKWNADLRKTHDANVPLPLPLS